MAFDVAKIEERIDRAVTGSTEIIMRAGPVRFQNFGEVMEYAKAMSTADIAVPQYLRGNPGACLKVCTQALEWNMSPWAVADQSYVANDRVAYQSQLIHAIVEARAPLKGRLRHEITGAGDERRCTVSATFKGEDEPHRYTSETLAVLRGARGTNERGQVKGSPLWTTQPEVQLYYSATRTWARMFCPDIILGIYAPEELPDDEPKEINPVQGLKDRLTKGKRGKRGFDSDHVERETTKAQNGKHLVEGSAVLEQLDIEVEVKRKKAFDDGAAAALGAPTPEDLRQPGREAELEQWIVGNHSGRMEQPE